jgi:DNA-binding CsgD family transcriptional regulator
MRGQPEAAIQSLEPLTRMACEPLVHQGIVPWKLLYVEALGEEGQLEAAASSLAEAEHHIQQSPLSSILLITRRLRGQLEARAGRVDRALSALEVSLTDRVACSTPFEVARLDLAYGALLRRMGRRRAAIARLQSARDVFLVLRARPFVERCDLELSGSGLRSVRRTPDERETLTAQELAVARLAAEGFTNRQIAGQLVLSPRTVEYHLQNVYGKLAITSRSQLVRYMLTPR